jgi:hypothetical protein
MGRDDFIGEILNNLGEGDADEGMIEAVMNKLMDVLDGEQLAGLKEQLEGFKDAGADA